MKAEKEQLIHDVLADESRQEATLRAGAAILRGRRHWRVARQTLLWVALAAAAALLLKPDRQHQALARATPPSAQRIAPAQAQSLTDDQLLALFPNTPVGLATLPNGRKLLIFPRPADEARLVTRF
jgi:hypothetical protein